MALKSETKRLILLVGLFVTVVVGGFGMLIWSGQERQKALWDAPMYHRDPRAPKVCMCYWMRNAFYVPCSEVPEELLKEVK